MPRTEDLTRARRKLLALRRAELRLRQRFESIDYELDVLKPELEELDAKAARGELPEITFSEDS